MSMKWLLLRGDNLAKKDKEFERIKNNPKNVSFKTLDKFTLTIPRHNPIRESR
jgi:hypothetical protein